MDNTNPAPAAKPAPANPVPNHEAGAGVDRPRALGWPRLPNVPNGALTSPGPAVPQDREPLRRRGGSAATQNHERTMDHEKIRQRIEGYAGLCPEGRAFVTDILREAVGYSPPEPMEPKPGEVWQSEKGKGSLVLIRPRADGTPGVDWQMLSGKDTGKRGPWDYRADVKWTGRDWVRVAESLAQLAP